MHLKLAASGAIPAPQFPLVTLIIGSSDCRGSTASMNQSFSFSARCPANEGLSETRKSITLRAGKTIPRTPLAITMAKLQQAEADHTKERVQMRRDFDFHRRKASSLEHRYNQLQAKPPLSPPPLPFLPPFPHSLLPCLPTLKCQTLPTRSFFPLSRNDPCPCCLTLALAFNAAAL